MTSKPAVITQLLATVPPSPNRPYSLPSIGVVLGDERVFWGECPIPAQSESAAFAVQRLLDLSTPLLCGQRVGSFRELCARLRSPEDAVEEPVAGLQQALLSAVAYSSGRTAVELLAAEYGVGDRASGASLFVEISDFAASAARIDEMLALRPAGIGYRLTGSRIAEAIGANGEYLQRFARELAQRVARITEEEGYRPALYLGFNGALGKLVDDPRRQIGKILGNCVGLQEAVGSLALYLEEPFLLDDDMAQAALLRQLRTFIGRSLTIAKYPHPPRLVARTAGLSIEQLSVYGDVGAVDALVFDAPIADGIDHAMLRLASVAQTGTTSLLSLSGLSAGPLSPRWAATIVDMAMATNTVVLLSHDHGSVGQFAAATRHMAEMSAWLKRLE